MKRGRPSNEQKEADKKYWQAVKILTILPDITKLGDLLNENPSYSNDVLELMRPYIKSPQFFDALLLLAADNPELHNNIKKVIR